MIKKFAVHIFIFCFTVSMIHTATAQRKRYENNTEYMIGANIGLPLSAMKPAIKNKMGDAGFGVSFLLLSNPMSWGKGKSSNTSPLRIGGEVGYTYYGRFKTEVDIQGNKGNYKTSYGIAKLNAIVRLRPEHTEVFTPFADIFAGGNFYLSSVKQDLSFIESALGLQSPDLGGQNSAVFVKGIAVGFTAGSLKRDAERFFFRLSYTMGSHVNYIVRDSLDYDPGSNSLYYYIGTAPVKYFMVELGVSF